MIIAAVSAVLMLVGPNGSWTRFDAADAKLAATYEAVMAHRRGSGFTGIRSLERAWIAQRNRRCGFETRNACSERLTVDRVAYLETLLPTERGYRSWSNPRLIAVERKLDDACRSPGQDSEGKICSLRDAAFAEMQRRHISERAPD